MSLNQDCTVCTYLPSLFFDTNQPDFQAWLQYKVWNNLRDSFSYFSISYTSKYHNPTSINELAATVAWMTLHIPLFLKIWHPRCFLHASMTSVQEENSSEIYFFNLKFTKARNMYELFSLVPSKKPVTRENWDILCKCLSKLPTAKCLFWYNCKFYRYRKCFLLLIETALAQICHPWENEWNFLIKLIFWTEIEIVFFIAVHQ